MVNNSNKKHHIHIPHFFLYVRVCVYSPICLNRPLAAKMTKCGHIFCWPCLLRHIAFCKDDPKKKRAYCPICMTYLNSDDLKSVELRRSTEVAEGATVEMQLMVKDKSFTMGVPYDVWRRQGRERALATLLPQSNRDYARFSHFSLSSDTQGIALREEDELLLLREQCVADGCADLMPFVEGAIELARAQIIASTTTTSTSSSSTGQQQQQQQIATKERDNEYKTKIKNEMKSNDVFGDVCDVFADESLCFYYQIATGENIFLGGFNMAMLEKEVEAHRTPLPVRISAKVVAVESLIQSEEVRRAHRRFKFLPLTASFTLVEADASFFHFSKDVYGMFAPKIRAKRAQRERQRRLDKAEKEALEARPMFPAPPVFADTDFLPLLPQAPPTLDECPPLSAAVVVAGTGPECTTTTITTSTTPTPAATTTTTTVAATKSPWGSGALKITAASLKKEEEVDEFPALGGGGGSSGGVVDSGSNGSVWGKRNNGNNSRINNTNSDSALMMYLKEERRMKEDMEQRKRDLIREDEHDYNGDDAEDYIPPSFRTSFADSLAMSLSASSSAGSLSGGNNSNNKKKKKKNKKKKTPMNQQQQ